MDGLLKVVFQVVKHCLLLLVLLDLGQSGLKDLCEVLRESLEDLNLGLWLPIDHVLHGVGAKYTGDQGGGKLEDHGHENEGPRKGNDDQEGHKGNEILLVSGGKETQGQVDKRTNG